MSRENQRFDTWGDFVSLADSWLGDQRYKVIIYDTAGRLCIRGVEAQRAYREGKFPLHWITPEQMIEATRTLREQLDNEAPSS